MLLGSDALGHQALGAGTITASVGVSLGAASVVTTYPATLGPTYLSGPATSTITTVSTSLTVTMPVAPAASAVTTVAAALKWSGLIVTPVVVDNTGTSANILDRVKQLLPARWFAWLAPYRDAVLGGLSDSAAWCYRLIQYARAQTRLSTAYGIWLDIFAYDFLGRHIKRSGSDDNTFRARIRATILQERVTRAGMINAVQTLTGKTPWVFEPWNTYDTGGYSGKGAVCGSFGYGIGQGGYGNMSLPCQTFMLVHKGAGAGVPGIGGYGNSIEGYGAGAGEYVGPQSEQSGITDQMVRDVINTTKPTGSTCWTQIVV